MDASLLSVKSRSEEQFLLEFLKPIRGFYHLDVEPRNGKLDSATQYEKWHPGQPDSCCGTDVKCIQMDSGTGLWFDEPCAKAGAIACKYILTDDTNNSVVKDTSTDSSNTTAANNS
uniref:C-type lectin domain-containing protein n=1 Tax=Syphacia muris TaxID=451379 RepID=A0A0N5A9V0_9BILA